MGSRGFPFEVFLCGVFTSVAVVILAKRCTGTLLRNAGASRSTADGPTAKHSTERSGTDVEAGTNAQDVTIPSCLLAGEADDITTHEQVFAAEQLFGTPKAQVTKQLVAGGHIGLFMGRQTLQTAWPAIARWIASHD